MFIELKLTVSFIYYLMSNFVLPDVISICNVLNDIFFAFHVARNYVFLALGTLIKAALRSLPSELSSFRNTLFLPLLNERCNAYNGPGTLAYKSPIRDDLRRPHITDRRISRN